MLGKMLFYSNDSYEFDEFLSLLPKLVKSYEVAFSTDDHMIRRGLAIKKYLVVNPSTYNSDVIISNRKTLCDKKCLSIKELKELL